MSAAERRDRVADIPVALLASVDAAARRALVNGAEPSVPPRPTGIDFVEVLPLLPGRAEERTLAVHLLRGPVPEGWDARRVAVVGGVRADARLNPVEVEWAMPAGKIIDPSGGPPGALPPGLTAADRQLVTDAVAPERIDRVLIVRTKTPGDLSGYILRIVADDDVSLPPELDPPLAQDLFSFAIDCPTTLDCVAAPSTAVEPSGQPILDYLARDYPLLRRRLLDRMASLVPGWTDTTPADIGVTLIELMAHLGDLYAYRQDAAAVEAYLTTARQRASVRRHARLLGHAMPEGCAARAWLAFTVDESADVPLPAGFPIGDGGRSGPTPGQTRRPVEAVEAGSTVFETTRPVTLTHARNKIPLHNWGDRSHVLPVGATSAFLAVPDAAAPKLQLRAGDVLVLAELPRGGVGDAHLGDPAHRQAVRLARDTVVVEDAYAEGITVLEIRWVAADALIHPLIIAEAGPDGKAIPRAVALANVVLADAGASVRAETLPQVGKARYRPRLARTGVAFVDRVDPRADQTAGVPSATAAVAPSVEAARAALSLDDGRHTWTTRGDLIGSSAVDPHVVVEPDERGVAWLRFGDSVHGRRPSDGTLFVADYRVGFGASGNVSPGRLTEPLLGPNDAALPDSVKVWNPLAATGGQDPEAIHTTQQLAPHASGRRLRAVTVDDHRLVAEEIDGVQRATARRRWTGSWHAMEVLVDAEATRDDDPTLTREVLGRLERRRMAALDVEVRRPVWTPVHVELSGCVLPGHSAAAVTGRLRELFSAGLTPEGRRGAFHPDRFTFGQPLRLSDLVATAMAVPGIAWVQVTGLRRLGSSDSDNRRNLADGELQVGPREVIRCDSNPSLPEFGRVDLVIGGGS